VCDPVSIAAAGAVASAAGTAITVQQQNAAVNAQNRAQQEAAAASSRARTTELARQDAYAAEARKRWEQQVADTGPTAANAAAEDMERRILGTQAEVAQTVDTSAALAGQDRAEAPTQQSIAAMMARAAADARRRVAGLSKVAGHAEVPQMFALNNQRFGTDLSQIVSKARTSANLARVEGDIPNATVGAGSALGSVLSGAGQMGLRYGTSRGAFQ